MAEVDADHTTGFHVDHEVGTVAVSDAENPVAHAQQSVGGGEVGPQREERLGAVAHLQESSPKHKTQDQTISNRPTAIATSVAKFLTYLSRSLGTCCRTLRKFPTALSRFAFLVKRNTDEKVGLKFHT